MKILELFSGYGTASFGLKQLGIPYELIGYSDIDKYANQCFRQNHYEQKGKCQNCGYFKDGVVYRDEYSEFQCGECFNGEDVTKELGDVTKINPYDLDDFDLLTGGFPCQAFSVAGKGLGELDTRGTLFNEIIRIAEVKKPRYMLLENVKGLKSKRHMNTFSKILNELDRIGYSVEWATLNTKDYGIPQNRERIFFVCFRNSEDWEKWEGFPKKEELNIFLKDILEKEVDKKYYLKQEQLDKVLTSTFTSRRDLYQGDKEVCSCLRARDYKEPKIIKINNPTHSNDRVYSEDGISPTLNTMQGGNRQPFIAASRSFPRSGTKEIDGERKQRLEPRTDGTPNTISTVQKDNYVCNDTKGIIFKRKVEYSQKAVNETIDKAKLIKGEPQALDIYNKSTRKGYTPTLTDPCHNSLRLFDGFDVRKLTPKECFRLQGFLNDEVDLNGLSNTQQYKLAGNGQSVNVVKAIFKEMFK